MARWIVAGVLLAVLIGLIAVDEFGLVDTTAVPDPPPVVDNGTIPGVEGVAAADAPTVEVEPEKVELEKACAPVTDRIREAKGDEWLNAWGEKVIEKIGAEKLQVLCGEVTALPVDQAIAKVSTAAGVTPE